MRSTQRFTARARAAVVAAVEEADRSGDDLVAPSHLLLTVVADPHGVAAQVLGVTGAGADRLRAEVGRRRASGLAGLGEDDAAALAAIGIDLDEVLRRLDGPRLVPRRRRWRGRFEPGAKKALELSLREALELRHGYIGTEHLLLGLLRTGDPVVVDALRACGASYDDVRAGVRQALRRAG